MSTTSVLVIGGTGTMGKPLVSELYNKGYKVDIICRKKVNDNRDVKYYYGDAKDKSFMKSVLSNHYNVIVDFCMYSSAEFKDRYESLLEATDKYVCLSSSAVYANVDYPKSESAPLYIEVDPPVVGGENFKWYCYEKARIEETLRQSKYKNWTIIRPGMTMNNNHFYWGNWIDEEWSFRIVHGKTVVIPRDMLSFKASITYGGDVTPMIMAVVTAPEAIGQTYNVTSKQVFSWQELLDLYRVVFGKYGIDLKIKYIDSCDEIIRFSPSERYVYERARLLDRIYDSSKIYELTKVYDFADLKEKLVEWVGDYIQKKPTIIRSKKVRNTALLDKITGEKTARKFFVSTTDYFEYLIFRYMSGLILFVRKIRKYLGKYLRKYLK